MKCVMTAMVMHEWIIFYNNKFSFHILSIAIIWKNKSLSLLAYEILCIPDSGVLWNTEMLHFPSFAPWEILTENSYMLSADRVSIIILLWVLSLYSQRADSPFSLYLIV